MTVLLATEARLWIRDPFNALFGVLLPGAVLAGLGAVPALREPAPMFGGGTFLEYFAPSMLAISVAVLGLQALPVGLATYREKGILRRFAEATFLSDNRADLARVRVPSLVLQCADDAIAPEAVGAYVHQHLAGSTLHRLRATGHAPHLSHPDETVAAIRRYLTA